MEIRQYFIEALQANAHYRKEWALSMFTVTRRPVYDSSNTHTYYPYQLMKFTASPDDKRIGFIDPADSETLTLLNNASIEKPIALVRDKLTLYPGDLPNVSQTIDTRYGEAYVNAVVLVYPFGSKIPYIAGSFNGDALEKKLAKMLQDTPPADQPRLDTVIYVDELIKYQKAMSSLGGLAQVNVPSATPMAMTIAPEVIKRRDELLELHKDHLQDPAIQAAMAKELSELDKASLANDPSAGFYIKSKSFDVTRMKSLIFYGAEKGFSTTGNFIPRSLDSGWDVSKMPDMVNALRAGSYNRGAQTALGGESVKYFYRVFQNTAVVTDDCGTTKGLAWVVTESNHKTFNGLYLITNGISTLIGESDTSGLVGKTIIVRSPLYCLAQAPSFCAKCVGVQLASNPKGLHVAISDVGSVFMSRFMAAMHGKAMKTVKYDVNIQFG